MGRDRKLCVPSVWGQQTLFFCLQEGVPEAGSDREVEFLKHKQVLMDIVRRILQVRREGEGLEELPFIDSMLQNYDSEDKVMCT